MKKLFLALALALPVTPVFAQADEETELKAAVQMDSPVDAAKAVREFITKHPQSPLIPAAHFVLTRALLGADAPSKEIVEEARQTLALVPASEPGLVQARSETVYGVVSKLIERKEMLGAAHELVKTASDSLPADPDADQLRRAFRLIDASILSAEGKRDEAIAAIQKVVAEDPDSQAALITLAEELAKAGRNEEAIDAYVRAESVFDGDKVDGAALRELYKKKNGSLEGLDTRLATAHTASLKRVALDARRVEQAAPDWELKDLNGEAIKLSALKGQVVVLDFWATWCPPCREELPHIQALHGDYTGKNVRILAVNCEGAQDAASWEKIVRSFVLKNKYTFTIVNDLEYKVNEAYKVDAFPTVFVIDKAGTVRYVNNGYEPSIREILKAQIDSLAN
jgi:thiol-disulfide isomerase/thioredoxin